MSGPGRSHAIVFDLDGTLVDSLPDIVASFREAFERRGSRPPAPGEVRRLVGRPLEEMYAVFEPDPEGVAALATLYREIYPQRFTRGTRPYPGVPEVLASLRARGWRLAVATTKRSEMARRLVRATGLEAAVDWVQGTDGFPHKPAPDVIQRALAALAADGAWMVGDTVGDLRAGRAAGLRTFGVSWGTHDRARLAEAEPDVLADDLDALPRWAGAPPPAHP